MASWNFFKLSLLLACLCYAHPIPAATVVLDTGHTLKRPGSMSPNGYTEYAYNLQLSNFVADALTTAGIRVIRTGADGAEISLVDRTIRTRDADLFVSIHHDSIQQDWIDRGWREKYSGFAVLVSKKNPSPARSQACARMIGLSLTQSGEKPSLYHASPIPGENRPLLDPEAGIHQYDELVVLKKSRAPAILVEAGVIANPHEELRLAQPATAQHLGRAIAAGILGCLKTR